MNRSLIETVMGAVVLVVAGLFVTFVYGQRTVVSAGDGYGIKAIFDSASGISPGTDVRIGGIKIGTVTTMELQKDTYRAQVDMLLKPDVKIPDDSSAAIVSDGLLGSKYVQLTPGADEKMLAANGEIKYTQSAVNLEEMIGKFMFSGGGVDKGSDDAKDKKPAESTLD